MENWRIDNSNKSNKCNSFLHTHTNFSLSLSKTCREAVGIRISARRNFVTFRGCWPRKTRETPYSKKVARDSCLVGAHPPVLLVFPLCLVFPPVDRHSRLDLSHYYTRFSYYTRHPFYLEALCREEVCVPLHSAPVLLPVQSPSPSFRSRILPILVISVGGRCTRLSLR